jgi:hypothetical protein
MYVKRAHNPSGRIPVWENIILIKADSEEMAFAKAQERGKQDEGDEDGTFRWDGEPATWVFAGVRKVTLCEDSEKQPGDGCEISYTEMEINSEQGLLNLLNNKCAEVRLTDFTADLPVATTQHA